MIKVKARYIYFLLSLVGFFLLGLMHIPEIWNNSFSWNESFNEYIPWRVEAARQLTEGHFPFFTPRVFGGMPLFATSYNGVLYPPNWLYGVFNPSVANWLMLFHVVLGGAGMYLYLRSRKFLPVCSFIGGAFFLSSTFFLCHKCHISMVETGFVVPWVVYFARRFLISGNVKFVIYLSLAIGLLISIGYQQLYLFAVVWIGFDWLSVFRLRRDFYIKTGWLAFAGVAGTLLLAVQIVPAMELAEYTPRQRMTFNDWTHSSFPLAYMPLFVCGRVFGFTGAFVGKGNATEVLVVISSFIWSMMVFFVLVSFLSKKYRFLFKRWVLVFGLGLVITLLLSMGHYLPGYKYLFHIPPFNMFRIPSRWLYLVNVFGIIMGMGGLQVLLHFKWWKRFPVFISCWIVWCFICLLCYYIGRAMNPNLFPNDYSVLNGLWLGKGIVGDHIDNMVANFGVEFPQGILDGPVFLWAFSLLLGVGLALPRRWFVCFAGFVVAFLLLEKGVYLKHSYWGSDRFDYVFVQKEHPLLREMDSSKIQRIYSLVPDRDYMGEHAFPGNTFLFQGYYSLNGYCPLINDRYLQITGMGQGGCQHNESKMIWNPNPLKQLGVSHVFARRGRMTEDVLVPYEKGLGHVYHKLSWWQGYEFVELEGSRPRFDFAESWSEGTDEEVWNAVWEIDPSVEGAVTVLEKPPRTRLPDEDTPLKKGIMSILVDDPSYQKLAVNLDEPGILLVRDVWWPGWEYRLSSDSHWHRVRRANGLIRYVPIPEGQFEVELKYVAPGFKKGVTLSVVGFLMIVGMVFRRWMLRRSRLIRFLRVK